MQHNGSDSIFFYYSNLSTTTTTTTTQGERITQGERKRGGCLET